MPKKQTKSKKRKSNFDRQYLMVFAVAFAAVAITMFIIMSVQPPAPQYVPQNETDEERLLKSLGENSGMRPVRPSQEQELLETMGASTNQERSLSREQIQELLQSL
jgi:hypothetical protein